jgi:putative peptidoglycan lipid II flippase
MRWSLHPRRTIPSEPKTGAVAAAGPAEASRSAAPPGFRRGRTVGIVGVLTLIVAIFGYLREAMLAARFGVSSTMDAYFAAVSIPTILYLVLIAGTLSPLFIPILLRESGGEDRSKASETFSIVTNFVVVLFVAIISLGVIAAPKWLPLLFPGFSPATTELALRLTRIIFPAVLFLALTGILTAVLNGFHRFALAAFAPALSSVIVIAAALFARGEHAMYVVGIATAAGFVAQFLLLVPATAALGIRYRPVLNLRHPSIRKLIRLGVPLLLYLAVANAAVFLERNLASRISAGAVSILGYAMRLFTLPAGFFAAPLAIVAYPQFAHEAVRPEYGELREKLSPVFRLVVFLFLPITLFTILNALPIIRLLYEHGRFNPVDSAMTSQVLALYAMGIFPNAIAIVLLRCYYAIQDTVTPLWSELVNLVFYFVAAPLMANRFGIQGLAITRGISFFPGTIILLIVLWKKRGLFKFGGDFLGFFSRSVIATLAMGLVSWMCMHLLQPWFDSSVTLLRLGIIFLVIFISGAALLMAAHLLSLREGGMILKAALDLVSGRPNRGPLISPPEM